MVQRSWLVQRAFLALGLMIGFYALAIGIALALLWVPYAEWVYLHRVHGRLALFCVALAGALLWAILPRVDRFEPPGPSLDRADHPRLFEVIESVASATGQAMPTEVFLVNDVNAWVAHRGGVMGIGSRRVMGVGLPLLQALSVDEFRAVAAHEFGHYSAGDVALGPWVYKTRAAIGRTLEGLEGRALQKLFAAYGHLFLRLTQAVSRQQEFLADQVAARTAGSRHAATSLKKMPGVAQAFGAYGEQELLPVLRAGFIPPISAGFQQFLSAEPVARRCEDINAAAVNDAGAGEFDTHPSIGERLAALGHPADIPVTVPAESAAHLLGDAEEMARVLLMSSAGEEAVNRLKPVAWNAVGDVFAAGWREAAKTNAEWLARFRTDDLPVGSANYVRLGGELNPSAATDDKRDRAVSLIGAGMAVALLDAGWTVSAELGQPLFLLRPAAPGASETEGVNPFGAVHALCAGTLTPDAWRARCHELGIAGLPLGAAFAVQRA